jgi:hypothetical protein
MGYLTEKSMTTALNPNIRELAVFLDAASQNQQQIIKQYPDLYSLLDELQQSFERMLGTQYKGPGVPALLVLTAQGYFLAGVRLALGGQMPPVYPVLRAGMESVLFGLLVLAKRPRRSVVIPLPQKRDSKSYSNLIPSCITA